MNQNILTLINALKTGDFYDRRDAIKSLSTTKEDEAVDTLIETLNHDDESLIRSFAAEALGEIGDERAIPHLTSGLDSNEQDIQRYCCRALAKFGSKTFHILCDAIHSDDWHLRGVAAEAMGESKNLEFTPFLLQALHDRAEFVNGNAAWALAKLGDPSVIDVLIEVLLKANKFNRIRFVHALRELGFVPQKDKVSAIYWTTLGEFEKCLPIGEFSIDPLITSINEKQQGYGKALEVLRKIGGPAIEPLKSMTTSGDKHIRECAIKTLNEIDSDNAKAVQAKQSKAVSKKKWWKF